MGNVRKGEVSQEASLVKLLEDGGDKLLDEFVTLLDKNSWGKADRLFTTRLSNLSKSSGGPSINESTWRAVRVRNGLRAFVRPESILRRGISRKELRKQLTAVDLALGLNNPTNAERVSVISGLLSSNKQT